MVSPAFYESAQPGAGPSPTPLPENDLALPALRESMLPEAWKSWVMDTADRQQSPPDFVASAALVSSGALIGNRIRILPKQNDSWCVVPNIWGAAVGSPGVMKTPAVNEGLIFIKEIAERERRIFDDARRASEFERDFREANRVELKKKMRGATAERKDQLRREYEALENPEVTEKRIMTADITIEKLGELLNQNPNGIMLVRDELTGWLKKLDQTGHEQDRSFALEAWNGLGTFTFDRIGRGTVHIKNLTLSVFGTIQPAMIKPYLQGSISGRDDDGLIQRIQITVYPDIPKEYQYLDRAPIGREAARASFENLYSATPLNVGAKMVTDAEGGYGYLRFDQTAQKAFQDWFTGLETELRSGAINPPALEAHLAKYRSLMPSLALIFHLIDHVTGRNACDNITLKYAELAIDWCTYLRKHAEKLYKMALNSECDLARKILDRIHAGSVPERFTARNIYGNHWGGLSNPDEVKRGLDILVDYDYLSQLVVNNGGRNKTVYFMHPTLASSFNRRATVEGARKF